MLILFIDIATRCQHRYDIVGVDHGNELSHFYVTLVHIFDDIAPYL